MHVIAFDGEEQRQLQVRVAGVDIRFEEVKARGNVTHWLMSIGVAHSHLEEAVSTLTQQQLHHVLTTAEARNVQGKRALAFVDTTTFVNEESQDVHVIIDHRNLHNVEATLVEDLEESVEVTAAGEHVTHTLQLRGTALITARTSLFQRVEDDCGQLYCSLCWMFWMEVRCSKH